MNVEFGRSLGVPFYPTVPMERARENCNKTSFEIVSSSAGGRGSGEMNAFGIRISGPFGGRLRAFPAAVTRLLVIRALMEEQSI